MEPSHFSWSAKNLHSIPLTERLNHLPNPLRESIDRLITQVKPLKIWIFGSRGRSDQHSLSDYDIAVEIELKFRDQWALFSIEEPEQIKMLLPVDWLLFNELSEVMQRKVLKEGTLLYAETR